jgi:hypothetical protein
MYVIFARDLKFAARTFLRRPAFFATVVLTLGLGIGAATAIISLVDATILRPLPYPSADRLVAIVEDSQRFGKTPFAAPFVREFREHLTQYDAIAAFTSTWDVTLTGVERRAPCQGVRIRRPARTVRRPPAQRPAVDASRRTGGIQSGGVPCAPGNRARITAEVLDMGSRHVAQ